MLVGQLAIMAFGVTDTIVAGRYSEEALAALSVGSAVYISVFVALMGDAAGPAADLGRTARRGRRHAEVGRSVRQALYLCALASRSAWRLGLLFPGALLRWTEVPRGLQDDVSHYLGVLALRCRRPCCFACTARSTRAWASRSS